MQKTLEQYDNVTSKCKALFEKKMYDYGSAWRILRLSSLTDQIFIKAQRIRGLQKNSIQMDEIYLNRQVITTYKLTRPKK